MSAHGRKEIAMIGRELAAITVPDQLARLLVAALLGSVIGFERERGERAAGLRTHALVSMASALMMLVSAYGFADVVTATRTVVLDPSRIAAQVVSGIGFLGAGAIILRKDTVRGLTTAGSIWLVAGLGLACGAGMYAAAGATTVLALLILRGFKLVEQRLFAHRRLVRVTLRMRRQPGQMDAIDARVRAGGLEMRRVQIEAGRAPDEQTVRVDVQGKDMAAFPALAERLRGVPGVRMVAYGARSLTAKESATAVGNESADDSA